MLSIAGREKLGLIHAKPRKGDIKHSSACIEKAKRILGYQPTIGTGKPTTIQQLAKTIINTANTKAPLEYQPKPKGDPHGG